MKIRCRHWMVASVSAFTMHTAIAAAMWDEKSEQGARHVGARGLEISLGAERTISARLISSSSLPAG